MIDRLKHAASRAVMVLNRAIDSRYAGIVLVLVFAPMLLPTCWIRSWRGRIVALSIALTVAVVVLWSGYNNAETLSYFNKDSPRFDQDPVTYWAISMGYVLAVSVLAFAVAGMLVGSAWRSRSPRRATLFACIAVILFNVPLDSYLVSQGELNARSEKLNAVLNSVFIVLDQVRRADDDPEYNLLKGLREDTPREVLRIMEPDYSFEPYQPADAITERSEVRS